MHGNTVKTQDIRTTGYVVKRTNYGEADRIINIITPLGKIAAIAKGVRKSRSKLAGGIEMFTLSEYNIHQGRSEFGIVTGAKMIRYHSGILKDYKTMELAGTILKQVSRLAESSDSPEYFKIVDQCLLALDKKWNLSMVESWFWLNLMKIMGEELNLYRDNNGEKLKSDCRYNYDHMQTSFFELENGEYGVDEIKIMRLMSTSGLTTIKKIKIDESIYDKILDLVRVAARA